MENEGEDEWEDEMKDEMEEEREDEWEDIFRPDEPSLLAILYPSIYVIRQACCKYYSKNRKPYFVVTNLAVLLQPHGN